MNQTLIYALNKFVDIVKNDPRCLGGWQFGSIARGLDDQYSDVDPVFLIEGDYFEEFDKELPKMFEKICDRVVVYWSESFNNDEIKSYGVDIQISGRIYQFDIFLLNYSKIDSWWCRLHYTDTRVEDIIFDRDGVVSSLISKAPKGEIQKRDILYCIETYWHHIHMLIKYFMRKDYFKLLKNINIIMQSHIELLLEQYDCISWGGWDSKIKYIPKEKQEHLMDYFASNDIERMKKNIKNLIELFSLDAREICLNKGIIYPLEMETAIKQEFCDI